MRDANPFTIAHMYKTAIQPILTYGFATIKLKPNDIGELEKVQASLQEFLLFIAISIL